MISIICTMIIIITIFNITTSSYGNQEENYWAKCYGTVTEQGYTALINIVINKVFNDNFIGEITINNVEPYYGGTSRINGGEILR